MCTPTKKKRKGGPAPRKYKAWPPALQATPEGPGIHRKSPREQGKVGRPASPELVLLCPFSSLFGCSLIGLA